MTGRSTLLPVALVVLIVFLSLLAIMSGRSNDPGVVGDSTYPHHICTFSEYCEGPDCTRDPASFVVYLEHADTNPLLDMPRVNQSVTLVRSPEGMIFETEGGEVRGTLTIFPDRALSWQATSGDPADPVEHYASGSCERLKTP